MSTYHPTLVSLFRFITARRVAVHTVTATTSLLVACGGVSSPSAGGVDASVQDTGTVAQDASSDDADALTPNDGGGTCTLTVSDGGDCNSLDPTSAPHVTVGCAVGAVPTGTGGALLDGTYVLSASTDYSGCDDSGTSYYVAETLTISGGCLQSVLSTNGTFEPGGGHVMRNSFGAQTSANTLSLTELCPEAVPPQTSTFTTTPTTITIFDATGLTVNVFTKI